MRGYSQFIVSLSKVKLTKPDDLISRDVVGFKLNPAGFWVNRCGTIANISVNLIKEIQDRVPYTPSGAQPIIYANYLKLASLLPTLSVFLQQVDSVLDENEKCMKHLNDLQQYWTNLQKMMETLGGPNAASMAQVLDQVQNSVKYVEQLATMIYANLTNYEIRTSTATPISDQSKIEFFHGLAATLVALDQVAVYMQLLSAVETLSAQAENFQKWSSQLFQLCSTFMEHQSDQTAISNDIVSLVANILPSLYQYIGAFQQQLNNTSDLTDVTRALVMFGQCLSYVVSRLKHKDLQELIKNFLPAFVSGQSLDSFIPVAASHLQFFTCFAYGQNLDAFNSSLLMTQICQNQPELSALVITSICRCCAFVFPSQAESEELLNSLCFRITDVTKSIFAEARNVIQQISSYIDGNLEFFNDECLAQFNLLLQNSKSIIDFIPTDQDFVATQQQFFEILGALPLSLNKLVQTCSDHQSKKEISVYAADISRLATRFSQWVVQFYLTAAAIIVLRADSLQSLVSYPLAVLCSIGMQQYLNTTLDSVKNMQSVLQSTQISLLDIDGISKLIHTIISFSAPGAQFVEIANRNNESPAFPLFKTATAALSRVNTKLPPLSTALSTFNSVSGNDSFTVAASALTFTSLQLAQGSQNLVERADFTSHFFASPPFTLLLLAESLINKNQPYSEPLVSPLNSVKSTIDVVWPIISSVAKGEDSKDKANIPTFTTRFVTALSELLSSVQRLPQPMLPYSIPDDVQEIKKFDAMADSIHSSLVKSFAKHIVRTMKRGKSSDARTVLMQWFEATQSQAIEVSDGLSRLQSALLELITSSTTDKSHFIEAFAALSVSLAATENSYGKSVSPHIQTLHKELVDLVLSLLENRGSAQMQLMRINACATKIRALTPISKLKQKEVEKYSAKIISRTVESLNSLRNRGRSATLHDTLRAVDALAEFSALSLVSPQEIDAAPLLNAVSAGKADSPLDEYISLFASRLAQLEPSMFNALPQIRDTDTVCDYVYDKAELFRDEVNALLTLSKGNLSKGSVDGHLLKMMLCAGDAAVLTMHSLMLGGLVFTPLSRQLVECSSELVCLLVDFSSLIDKAGDSLSADIRRFNRKMSKQFDMLINVVENPQRPSGELSDFETARGQMYANMSTVSVQIARIVSLSATALVPEMWTATRAEITDTLAAAVSQLQASVSAVRAKAVGATSAELGTHFASLQGALPELISSTETLDFASGFAPKAMLPPLSRFCSALQQIARVSPSLTDRIVIEPDHAAAGRVPERYELPPMPDKAPPASDALDELELAKRQLDSQTEEFEGAVSQALAPSGELLNALLSLRRAANAFAEKALSMARATSDSRSQVEQQATLHGFSNAVSAVQGAMRSRLLRSANFEHEMEDAISSLRAAAEASLRLGVEASKIDLNQPAEDDSMDEVTRELTATSKAIDEMTSRLAQFAQQVDIENIQPVVEESQIPDLDVSPGTLPAFLIASAQPIFSATAKILIRAREITAKLIERFGKIDNEAGMIKVAQDLTEAAELLIICAEIIVNGTEEDAEFKVIAAAKIIKAAVASLVAQVLVKGGDSEGIMSKLVKVVAKHTDAIIAMAEKIVDEKLTEAEMKAPKKNMKNPMIMKLNMQQTVNEKRKILQEEEKNLYTFRRRGNK